MARPTLPDHKKKSAFLTFRIRPSQKEEARKRIKITLQEMSFQGKKKNVIDSKLDKIFKEQEARRKKKQ